MPLLASVSPEAWGVSLSPPACLVQPLPVSRRLLPATQAGSQSPASPVPLVHASPCPAGSFLPPHRYILPNKSVTLTSPTLSIVLPGFAAARAGALIMDFPSLPQGWCSLRQPCRFSLMNRNTQINKQFSPVRIAVYLHFTDKAASETLGDLPEGAQPGSGSAGI